MINKMTVVQGKLKNMPIISIYVRISVYLPYFITTALMSGLYMNILFMRTFVEG